MLISERNLQITASNLIFGKIFSDLVGAPGMRQSNVQPAGARLAGPPEPLPGRPRYAHRRFTLCGLRFACLASTIARKLAGGGLIVRTPCGLLA
jgi:hypothetical protein